MLGVPALDMATAVDTGAPGMISPALRRLVRRVYFPDPATRADPYASPLLTDTVRGLPPAVVLTAERDTLRPDGDKYAARLRNAGIEVVSDMTPGADHYFLSHDLDRARRTMEMVAGQIRRRTSPA
ncbi:acetyl esterase/lipase [Nocardioides ginsengisegetis]|uniref:Acetyl esterase/lipase n=1 Tax=Nocardioides ginsengisegetis TaxID=661491 RepID=A0A7W3J3F4_9ACTN|nr:acetyl esterase/lipase [Nocardioides ginsengisegetis]